MLTWISSEDPADAFPDAAAALEAPNGLLAAGGDLSTPRLIAAYTRGIFPWYEEGQPVLWWSPDPRAVLFPDELKISRSLRRTLKRESFVVSTDTAFEEVVAACAEPRARTVETWITREMSSAYQQLHECGFAHSVEVRKDDHLIGGLYGVAIGLVFFGESMFSRTTDASKVALVALVRKLKQLKYALIDCQVVSAHLQSLGCRTLARDTFLKQLDEHCKPSVRGCWDDTDWQPSDVVSMV